MDWAAKTIATYDESSEELANYFGSIGSRVEDIARGLELASQKKGVKVVEIGCGDGRDAAEIVKRSAWFRLGALSASSIISRLYSQIWRCESMSKTKTSELTEVKVLMVELAGTAPASASLTS